MPSFKPKNIPKALRDVKIKPTLDEKHRDILAKMNDDEIFTVPNLKKQRESLKRQLKNSQLTIEQDWDILDKIEDISKQIKLLKKQKLNYYLDNSKHLFEYFEHKKNIENASSFDELPLTSKTQAAYNFFKIKCDNDKEIIETNNIVNNYLKNVDEQYLDVNNYIHNSDICQYCHKGELLVVEEEGILLCKNCFVQTVYLIDTEKPSYKDPPKEVCTYAYKKINHFKEVISQFQAKETTHISDEIFDCIRRQIKKERIQLSTLTYDKTKEILKKLGYNSLYEHIFYIKSKLGIPPFIFSTDLEEKLCNMFLESQSPYSQVCPSDRVNFLHYYFALYKYLELLGETKYLSEIPMLKDRDKLMEQDEIWKKMCQILDWEYIPTILTK